MENSLNFLSTREGFNTSLKHFKIVNQLIENFVNKVNLADLVTQAINNNELKSFQIRALLNALLIDKFKYYAKSYNLNKDVPKDTIENSFKTISSWNAFDILLSYYHPQLGIILINPKNNEHIENISDGLKENELINIYIGCFNEEFDTKLAHEASEAIINLLEKRSVSKTLLEKLKSGSIFYTQPKKDQGKELKPISSESKKTDTASDTIVNKKVKLSPRYGVLVTNELFHNGNVEAWKRIIASYENKYKDTKVLVFYDNEQIHDINTLFKWGKVKHGTMIFFSLMGPEFKDASKLRRYLTQGASIRFEDFLKGTPNQILNLF